MNLPQIAQRAFDTPLLAEPRKAHAFIRGLGARIAGRPVAFDDDYEEADHQAPPPFASLLGDELAEGLKRDRYGYGVRDGIGIIPIGGTLIHRGAWVGKSSGQTTYEGIGAQLTAAMDDPTVQAIALEVDSFGGEVAGCFDLADRIRTARETKPIWAFLAENFEPILAKA